MPRINIYEQEDEVVSLINTTDTAVLVPLVCQADTSTTAKLYKPSQKSIFASDFGTKVIEQSEGGTALSTKERSFMYAYTLMSLGLNVVIKPIRALAGTTTQSESQLTTYLSGKIEAEFEEFKSKNAFNIKFITTGAHANFTATESSGSWVLGGCYDKLAAVAAARGDCVALIELENDVICSAGSTAAVGTKDIKTILAGGAETTNTYIYSACFYPWCTFNVSDGTTNFSNMLLPASFAYLSAFANSTQTNADWYAAAGVSRGGIPNFTGVNTGCNVTDTALHILLNEAGGTPLKFNVNPIMTISEYGYRIWGNKVAMANLDAKSFRNYLNVRMLLCNIEKQIYAAATRVTFEPNDMITWLNFQNLANELLDDMQANRGIEWYSWRRVAVNEKALIKAVLTIKPIEAVESFDITVNLSNEEVSVAEA